MVMMILMMLIPALTLTNELIAQKTEFEHDFILEFRDLFSKSLSPNPYLQAPRMRISHKNSPDRSRDQFLSRLGDWLIKQVDDIYVARPILLS